MPSTWPSSLRLNIIDILAFEDGRLFLRPLTLELLPESKKESR